MPTENPFTVPKILDNWSEPIGAIAVLMGAVAWLTTLHSLATQNREAIVEIRQELDQTKTEISLRINDVDQRLGRIEGKLDMLIDMK